MHIFILTIYLRIYTLSVLNHHRWMRYKSNHIKGTTPRLRYTCRFGRCLISSSSQSYHMHVSDRVRCSIELSLMHWYYERYPYYHNASRQLQRPVSVRSNKTCSVMHYNQVLHSIVLIVTNITSIEELPRSWAFRSSLFAKSRVYSSIHFAIIIAASFDRVCLHIKYYNQKDIYRKGMVITISLSSPQLSRTMDATCFTPVMLNSWLS